MKKPTIGEVLTPKPEARPRIYAYAIADAAHHGQLKVGQTTRDVKQRVAEQLKTAAIENFSIELDEPAERDDGSIFTDHDVRAALVKKGFEKVTLEWVRCTVADVATALAELRSGQRFGGTHHETFGLRDEQLDAVNKTLDYYQSHLGRRCQRRTALFVECQDALWQNLHRLPAGQKAADQARAGVDL